MRQIGEDYPEKGQRVFLITTRSPFFLEERKDKETKRNCGNCDRDDERDGLELWNVRGAIKNGSRSGKHGAALVTPLGAYPPLASTRPLPLAQ
jgi:hypothetical protein